MFGNTVLKLELMDAKAQIESLKRDIDGYRATLVDKDVELKRQQMSADNERKVWNTEREFWERGVALKVEETKAALRSELLKQTVQSDIARATAEASLSAYKEIDSKDQTKKIIEFLGDAINGLSAQKVTVHTHKD